LRGRHRTAQGGPGARSRHHDRLGAAIRRRCDHLGHHDLSAKPLRGRRHAVFALSRLAHLSAWCEERAIAYQGVPVGTIKRYATGKGNADKAAMIAAMRARGFAPVDDNEADALALLLWATDAEGGRA
jgi:hypothetical protein